MLIPFIGYALNRRFIGYVDCEGERLTELLNGSESILLRQAFVESFEEDTVVSVGDGEMERSALYAVESGARGDPGRRIHGGRHRLELQLGPYAALGLLSPEPDPRPLPQLGSHGPMIPLADATIGFMSRGAMTLRDVGTLIVNRDRLDWVRANDADAAAFPGVPVVTNRR